MTCADFERWISDRMDGALSADRDSRLRSHLAACASCRDFEHRARRIQAGARAGSSGRVPEGYWRDSLARLRRSLGEKDRGPRKKAFFAWGRRWVFAAAPLVLAAAAGLLFVLRPGGSEAVPFELAADERLSLITQELGDDPALETAFNNILESSIGEHLGSGGDLGETSMENPLLDEDISEAEMSYIIEELKKELGS